MKKIFAFAVLALAAMHASAERADSTKQTVVNYDALDIDDVSQTSIVTGNVVVTKGTLILKSDKAVIKETPEGYMHVTLTSAGGKSATFRQKRDGGPDLWVEGEAQRIEYDERADVLKLFVHAKIRQLEGTKPTDQFESEYIAYDSRKELLNARNDASGQTKPGQGRGTMIIAPRKPKADAAAAPASAPAPAAPAGGTQSPAGGTQ
ncbi:MAG: lipopolysaccharide transport periplasmic protein LptA [Gammaproteobacteria bacterium]